MNTRILLVDDEESVLSTLKRLLRNEQFEVYTATGGEEGLEVLSEHSFDLIVSDMRMPKMNGAEFLSIAKARFPLIERVLLTGYSDMEDTIQAINDGGIYGYVSKPWDPVQLRELIRSGIEKTKKNKKKNRVLHHFKKENDALTQDLGRKEREMAQTAAFVDFAQKQLHAKQVAQDALVKKTDEAYAAVSQALEDSYVVVELLLLNLMDLKLKGQRSINQRVSEVAMGMAETLCLDASKVMLLRRAARLYALGKIGVPDAILAKAYNQLDENERSVFQQYPSHSACTLMAMAPFQDVAQLLFNQREYLDGSGYPNGLAGEELDTVSRILALSIDYVEYRSGHMTGEALSHDDTMSLLQSLSKRYDERLLVALASLTLEIDVKGEGKALMLPVHSLAEGMLLNKDIVSEAGILLLRGGTILNAAAIRHLTKLQANLTEQVMVSVRFQAD